MADAQTAKSEHQELKEVLDRTVELANSVDSFEASTYLETTGEPLVVAYRYSELLHRLYFKEKNIPLMVSLGEAGIRFSLREAGRCSKSDAAQFRHLKGLAKTIAYNLGANTWPGWDEPGIEIDAFVLQAGYHAASLNRRLAKELNRGEEVLANAEWLVGAHQLASKAYASAEVSFQNTANLFRQVNKLDAALMAEGYVAITHILGPNENSTGIQDWAEVKKKLSEVDSDDARFYIEQIEIALQVFGE
ncbi:hypothetical protein [Polystyrenella longa]|nr:hypothetical protein [Polystyrenella longa]